MLSVRQYMLHITLRKLYNTVLMTDCPLIDNNGLGLVNWITALSGNCVYGTTSALSWLLGCMSFCFWLGAQLPQVAENYVNQSVEGLSMGFLLNWFIGDFTNLMGCVLTHQLPFQTALALYYVCIDLILGTQYLYYSRLDERRRVIRLQGPVQGLFARGSEEYSGLEDSKFTPNSNGTAIDIPRPSRRPSYGNMRPLLTSSFVASFSKVASAAPIIQRAASSSSSPIIATSSETVGRLMAWICTIMYLTSRLPQIYKNYKRKSTWGTSLLLFMATFSGNTTYTLSILLSREARGSNKSEFLINELPFLIGSAGTIVFDVVIFFQNYIYGRVNPYTALQTYSGVQNNKPLYLDSPSLATSTSVNPVTIGEARRHPKDTTPLAYSLQTNYSESIENACITYL